MRIQLLVSCLAALAAVGGTDAIAAEPVMPLASQNSGAAVSGTAAGLPGSRHTHARQQMDYGQGYRYGHRAGGVRSDILIWSPRPYTGYGSAPHGGLQPRQQAVAMPPTGPRLQYKPLQYKPGYGKPPVNEDED